jgi:UDP-3-O-[3-hydroxymyristoyl] glucosamine N-acyltransferase
MTTAPARLTSGGCVFKSLMLKSTHGIIMKKLLTDLYIKSKTLGGELSLSVDEISKFIGGTVIGNGKAKIRDIVYREFAGESDMTFALDERELEEAAGTKAACVVTTIKKDNYPKTILLVDDIKKALVMMYNGMLEIKPPKKGQVHPTAVIAKDVKTGKNADIGPYATLESGVCLGDNVRIGANCFIGEGTTIGDGTIIYPNVVIYDHMRIGRKVIIHASTVIGADGFGFVPKGDKIYKVPQMGNVVIGDNVEIGSCSCIDRGTFGQTVIGDNTKIDNLVQIAHNVKIGKNVFVAGQSGIAGSSTVGDNTMMGGQVGISDHVDVGKNVKLAAKTGISGRVPDGRVMFGYPAREASETKQMYAALNVITKYRRQLLRFLKTLPARSGEDKKEQGEN